MIVGASWSVDSSGVASRPREASRLWRDEVPARPGPGDADTCPFSLGGPYRGRHHAGWGTFLHPQGNPHRLHGKVLVSASGFMYAAHQFGALVYLPRSPAVRGRSWLGATDIVCWGWGGMGEEARRRARRQGVPRHAPPRGRPHDDLHPRADGWLYGFIDDLVREIFAASLTLAACASSADPAASRRIVSSVHQLDAVIRGLRTRLFQQIHSARGSAAEPDLWLLTPNAPPEGWDRLTTMHALARMERAIAALQTAATASTLDPTRLLTTVHRIRRAIAGVRASIGDQE